MKPPPPNLAGLRPREVPLLPGRGVVSRSCSLSTTFASDPINTRPSRMRSARSRAVGGGDDDDDDSSVSMI